METKYKEYYVHFICYLHVHIWKPWSLKISYPSQVRTPRECKRTRIIALPITRRRSPQTWPIASATG